MLALRYTILFLAFSIWVAQPVHADNWTAFTGAEVLQEFVSDTSAEIDLRPGDLIATGSPEGSGGSRRPQRFLRTGDTLDIEVSGVGVLHNQVSAERGD